jgi:hypothetical protein
MNLEQFLRANLSSMGPFQRRVVGAILRMRGPAKEHALLIVEHELRQAAGIPDDQEVTDWSAASTGPTPIDWKTLLAQVLAAVLPLLLKILGG